MEDSKQGFKVEDKRRVSKGDSSGLAEAPSKMEDDKAQGTSKEQRETSFSSEEGTAETTSRRPETITFSTFIVSLHASALLHLGKLPDPKSGLYSSNIPLAKQTIDILGVLKEKTKDNLTSEEDNLLSQILYELRLEFVEAAKGPRRS